MTVKMVQIQYKAAHFTQKIHKISVMEATFEQNGEQKIFY